MTNINIDNIRKKIAEGNIKWTEHCSFRMFQRGIQRKDVQNTIMNGFILEQYPKDFPYPSCLISGKSILNNTIHIVCGLSSEDVYIITVYYPNEKKWIDEIRRKK